MNLSNHAQEVIDVTSDMPTDERIRYALMKGALFGVAATGMERMHVLRQCLEYGENIPCSCGDCRGDVPRAATPSKHDPVALGY